MLNGKPTVIDRRHLLALIGASAFASSARGNVVYPKTQYNEGFAKFFTDEGTAGTFVAYKVEDYVVIASDSERSGQAVLPASTFKIPNSLIALETGVVGDPDTDVFKWDGVKRDIDAWNQDQTMRSALAVSAVWVYQEIARRIGEARMQKYVDLFEYGNRNIGGGIDQFWLTGDLRIDPTQQIDFLERLRRGGLLISKRSQDLVRDILPVTKTDNAVLRTKSGLLPARDGKPPLGWIVGWAEKGQGNDMRSTVFALNMDCPEAKHVAARMNVTQRCLGEIGAI